MYSVLSIRNEYCKSTPFHLWTLLAVQHMGAIKQCEISIFELYSGQNAIIPVKFMGSKGSQWTK